LEKVGWFEGWMVCGGNLSHALPPQTIKPSNHPVQTNIAMAKFDFDVLTIKAGNVMQRF